MIVKVIKKILGILDNSYKKIHVLSLFLIAVLSIVVYFEKIEISNEVFDTLITTLGIMTTFFFLAVEKINFKNITKTFQKEIKIFKLWGIKNCIYTQGKLIKNTIFSLVILNVTLIFIIFTFYMFGSINPYLLIASIIYLFIGFTYLVSIWNLDI